MDVYARTNISQFDIGRRRSKAQPDDYAPYQQLDFSHRRLPPHMFPSFLKRARDQQKRVPPV